MFSEKLKNKFFSFLNLKIFQELSLSGIGCLFIILIFNIIPEDWHFSASSKHNYIPKAILSIIFLLFLIVFLVLNQPTSNTAFFKINYNRNIILTSIFNFTLNFFIFFNTEFIVYGVGIDNWYRTTYITHMASSGYPHDYCYKGLSAYYFPLYYYSLALNARIFNIEPYKMLRYGFLFICYIIPIVLYEIWKKIYDKKIAFAITVLSIAFLLHDSFIIDHVVAIVLLIPFIMYYYENCKKKMFKKKDYVIAGILGSFLFCIYATYFFVIPIYYLISLIQNKNKFQKNLKHIIIISTLIIAFSYWYWLPLSLDYINYGFEVHQNTFLNQTMVEIPFFAQIFPFSLPGLILFIGLIYILKNYSLSLDIKILGNIIISFFILIVIGFIGIVIKVPFFLYYRYYKIPKYGLIIAASIFYIRFFSFINYNKILTGYKIKSLIPKIEIYCLVILMFSQSYSNSFILVNSYQYQLALETEIPEDIIAIFEELDYEGKIFLTSHTEVCPYIPVYLFICPVHHFSHPSSHHNKRIEFLEDLAEKNTSKAFHEKIINCEFDLIDYFYLTPKNNSTVFTIPVVYHDVSHEDEFEIIFERDLFENEEYFEKIVIDGEIIYKTIY